MITGLDAALDEALGCYEAFRRLGFMPEEIFLGIDGDEVFMVLRSQGKQFTRVIARLSVSDAEIGNAEVTKRWTEKCAWWNDPAHEAERQALWATSEVLRDAVAFIVALADAGFRLDLD